VNAQAKAFNHIAQQMADNASFLWVLRDRQRREPYVYAEHIKELDGRIQANLDGLLLYGEEAWAIAQANGEFPQGGEAFCLGVLAFSGDDVNKIQYATEFALQNPDTFKGMVSALAWLPGSKVHPWITQFFQSKNLEHKRIALAACRVRREDPAGYLNAILDRRDCIEHLPLLAESFRCVDFFKRTELRKLSLEHIKNPDSAVAFWAIVSSGQAFDQLKPFCTSAEPVAQFSPRALLLAMTHLPSETARLWISEWVELGFLRLAVQACGFLGDPTTLPWVIEQMKNPELNRAAGEAFYLICGQQVSTRPMEIDDAADAVDSADESLHWVDPASATATDAATESFNFHVKTSILNSPMRFPAMKYQRYAHMVSRLIE
jgi:uncharacterized protein (TIGR02270 family)